MVYEERMVCPGDGCHVVRSCGLATRDARVSAIGKTEKVGNMALIGRDLYMADTEHLRRLKDIVPQP